MINLQMKGAGVNLNILNPESMLLTTGCTASLAVMSGLYQVMCVCLCVWGCMYRKEVEQ